MLLRIIYRKKQHQTEFELLSCSYDCLSKIERKKGNFKRVIYLLDSARIYEKLELDKVEKDKIKNLEEQFEDNVKKQEIDYLKKNNILYKKAFAFVIIIVIILGILINKITLASKKIKKINEFQEQLILIIGHDLRSPLVGVQGFYEDTQRLLKEKNYSYFPKMMQSIEKSHWYMNLLLSNLLDWVRFNQTSNKNEKVALHLKSFVEEINLVYEDIVKLYDSEIQIEIPEGIYLKTHKEEFAVIFRNGLDNAIKRAMNKKVLISASATQNTVHITINNSGLWLPEKLAEANFIFSSPTNLTDINSNNRFGLLLMSSFSKKIDCKLRVESNEIDGTTLHIDIPKNS